MGPARRSCIVFYGVLQGNVRNLLRLTCARKGVAGAKLNSNWRGLDCAYHPEFGCGSHPTPTGTKSHRMEPDKSQNNRFHPPEG